MFNICITICIKLNKIRINKSHCFNYSFYKVSQTKFIFYELLFYIKNQRYFKEINILNNKISLKVNYVHRAKSFLYYPWKLYALIGKLTRFLFQLIVRKGNGIYIWSIYINNIINPHTKNIQKSPGEVIVSDSAHIKMVKLAYLLFFVVVVAGLSIQLFLYL